MLLRTRACPSYFFLERNQLWVTADTPTRREFLKTAGAAIAVPYVITSTALGAEDIPPASERIVMGGIGIGNMGRGDQGAFLGRDDVQYVAVCDVRKGVRDQAKGKVDDHYKNNDCQAYNDFRELLARTDIDAVHVATPDHWHAIMVIEACRNGKDVYCQKPETRTLREGPLMVEAARRYCPRGLRRQPARAGRLPEDRRPCWGGELGTIKSINVNVGPLSQACNLPAEDVPPDIDWDMWLGPAPWAPYNKARCDGNFGTGGGSWRSYIDYSGGGMTDWGAHHFGGATFAVDVRELQPEEVIYNDDNGKQVSDVPVSQRAADLPQPARAGATCKSKARRARSVPAKPVPTYKGKGGIYGDFIECVKTRERPFRDIELAVNTVTLSHLGIIAYKLQRSLKWDAAKQQFPGDEEANRFLDRARREPWQL